MQDELNVLSEALGQRVDPAQAVLALVGVEADQAAFAIAMGGQIAAEQVKAARGVIVRVEPRSLRMLGAVAVHDKSDVLSLSGTGIIIPRRFYEDVVNLHPLACTAAKGVGGFVAPEIVVILMPPLVQQRREQARALPAEAVAVDLLGKHKRCGAERGGDQPELLHQPRKEPAVASIVHSSTKIWKGSVPKRPTSSAFPTRLRDR